MTKAKYILLSLWCIYTYSYIHFQLIVGCFPLYCTYSNLAHVQNLFEIHSLDLESTFPSFLLFFAAVINVKFESPSYTVREGSRNHVEVCVRATDSRIKTQQQLNVMVVITPVMSGKCMSISLYKFYGNII